MPSRAAAATALAVGLSSAVPAEAVGEQPFHPQIRATIDAPQPVARGHHPPLRTIVTQRRGEAALRRAEIVLPGELLPEVRALPVTCEKDRLERNACPSRSQVGTASATTQLLGRLQGPVYLANTGAVPAGTSGIGLPSLAIQLSDALRLDAEQRFLSTYRLRTVLDDLPPVLVERFELSFRATHRGPLVAERYLCARPLQPLKATFTSQDGRVVTRRVRVTIPACRRHAGLRASISGLRRAHPRARFRIRSGPAGRALHRVRLMLPSALTVASSAGVRVTAHGRELSRRRWSLTRSGVVRVRLGSVRPRVVRVHMRGAAVGSTRFARRRFGDDRTIRVLARARVTDVAGQVTTIPLRVQARR